MKTANYVKGAVKITDIPSEKPIVLLMGRSNVGKSSLINSLTNRKKLAHTSGVPGKTIVLNFYLINNDFYLVDAPGYGYAKRSKKMQNEFVLMIEDMLLKHPNIKSVMVVIDFKVGPTDLDIETINFLYSLNLDIIVVATKKDKIPKSKQLSHYNKLKKTLNNYDKFYAVSNTNKENIDALRNIILKGVYENEQS